jgi:hypothetical protein
MCTGYTGLKGQYGKDDLAHYQLPDFIFVTGSCDNGNISDLLELSDDHYHIINKHYVFC